METIGDHEAQDFSGLLSNDPDRRGPAQKIAHLTRGICNALGKASVIDFQQALEIFRTILAKFGHERIVRP